MKPATVYFHTDAAATPCMATLRASSGFTWPLPCRSVGGPGLPVVLRLDRLGRNLADPVRLIAELETESTSNLEKIETDSPAGKLIVMSAGGPTFVGVSRPRRFRPRPLPLGGTLVTNRSRQRDRLQRIPPHRSRNTRPFAP